MAKACSITSRLFLRVPARGALPVHQARVREFRIGLDNVALSGHRETRTTAALSRILASKTEAGRVLLNHVEDRRDKVLDARIEPAGSLSRTISEPWNKGLKPSHRGR